MLLYNVTVKVDTNFANDWLSWMRAKHIPDVLATGKFNGYKLCRLLNQDESDGITYAVQYFCSNLDDYNEYQTHFAPLLQSEHFLRYREHAVAFRTLLEVLED